MSGTLRTEICKVIVNVTKQSLTIMCNYFLGLEAFGFCHVYIKENGRCTIELLAKLDSMETADP